VTAPEHQLIPQPSSARCQALQGIKVAASNGNVFALLPLGHTMSRTELIMDVHSAHQAVTGYKAEQLTAPNASSAR